MTLFTDNPFEKMMIDVYKRQGQNTKAQEAAGNRRKLTRAEKKQIAEIIRQAKGDGKARTAQQTIPYIQMYPDGICKVSEKKYSKSVAFEDINYQLAQADEKTAIFENWCDFLNYFDASVSVDVYKRQSYNSSQSSHYNGTTRTTFPASRLYRLP